MSTISPNLLEALRLARMALAEIGSDGTVTIATLKDGSSCLQMSSGGEATKAMRLVQMKIMGPLAEVPCDVHAYSELWEKCGKVTVSDVLLGRSCHRARVA